MATHPSHFPTARPRFLSPRLCLAALAAGLLCAARAQELSFDPNHTGAIDLGDATVLFRSQAKAVAASSAMLMSLRNSDDSPGRMFEQSTNVACRSGSCSGRDSGNSA